MPAPVERPVEGAARTEDSPRRYVTRLGVNAEGRCGKLVLHIIAARNVGPPPSSPGPQPPGEPFVVVTEPGGDVYRTLAAKDDGQDPTWYERIEFDLRPSQKMAFSAALYYGQREGAPRLIGKLVVDYSAMVAEGRKVDAWLPLRDREEVERGELHMTITYVDTSRRRSLLPDAPLGLPASPSFRSAGGSGAGTPRDGSPARASPRVLEPLQVGDGEAGERLRAAREALEQAAVTLPALAMRPRALTRVAAEGPSPATSPRAARPALFHSNSFGGQRAPPSTRGDADEGGGSEGEGRAALLRAASHDAGPASGRLHSPRLHAPALGALQPPPPSARRSGDGTGGMSGLVSLRAPRAPHLLAPVSPRPEPPQGPSPRGASPRAERAGLMSPSGGRRDASPASAAAADPGVRIVGVF